MGKISNRKLFLFGKYSLAVLPPKKWLSELGVKRGDNVELELDRTKGRIIIKTGKPAPKKISKPKNRTDKPSKDDWQPIPQL
ncbi:AbrB/MazE/SpoVT family DNA-binding domain-containing protein [Candidatus Berkelbacteria bacterium]|nr:AbrB/MazE/SpoVT family DNA-binding domain-containing protein [Candidatus Berkelbacteria bacterium]